jgi:NAD(P)-dependent dehydrogenase (short-subunit alcohol dehydrogenase family)
LDLKDRTALVTGGGIRVGRAIVLELARAGMNLLVHYRTSRKEAEDVCRLAAEFGVRATSISADLGNLEELQSFLQQVESYPSPIDALILSASEYPRVDLETVSPEAIEQTLRINLTSPFLLAQRIGFAMKARGEGQIITLLDWSLGQPDPNYLPYHASKAGLTEVTYGLARALAPEVRVNGVAPGAVLLPENTSADRRERIRLKTPLQTIGSPEDISQAVRFLLESGNFITGHVLRVDGGRSII